MDASRAELQEQWDAAVASTVPQGPPPFVPSQPEQVPLVVAASKLRNRRDKLLLYHEALTTGDPTVMAQRRKEIAQAEADDSDDGDGPLIANDEWRIARERTYDAASAPLWAGMSESDIAREGYKARVAPEPRRKGKQKKKLFPQPQGKDLEALQGHHSHSHNHDHSHDHSHSHK